MECYVYKLRIVGHHQKLREKHGTDFPSEPPEGTNPANILTLDFCCFKPPSLWSFVSASVGGRKESERNWDVLLSLHKPQLPHLYNGHNSSTVDWCCWE